MANIKSAEIPLYRKVPSNPNEALVTLPLRNKVMFAVARDYLYGEIDYHAMTLLRRRFYNPLLTSATGALGKRKIWDIDHPALIPQEDK